MPNINTLPNDALTQVLLNLEPRDRAALAQTCASTRPLPVEGRAVAAQAITAEVQQVILIANKCLHSIRTKQAAENDGGDATPMPPMIANHLKEADRCLRMLEAESERLGEFPLPPHVSKANAQAYQDMIMSQKQQHISKLVGRLLTHIHRMDPQSTCFAELDRQEYCFLRRHLNQSRPACTLPADRLNSVHGFAKCMELANNGQFDEAITEALQIHNQKEQILTLSAITKELISHNQIPKVIEIFDRLAALSHPPSDTVTYFQNTCRHICQNYEQEQDADAKQKKMGLLLQFMTKSHLLFPGQAIGFVIEILAAEDQRLLFSHLQKMANVPSLTEVESAFIKKALNLLLDEPNISNDISMACQVLNEMHRDETLPKTLEWMCNNRPIWCQQIVSHDMCHPRIQKLILEHLIAQALRLSNPALAKELINLSLDQNFRSHGYFLLATYYLSSNGFSETHLAEELLNHIFDDYEHFFINQSLMDNALMAHAFDKAAIYASTMLENQMISEGKRSVFSRSHSFGLIIFHMAEHLRASNDWLTRCTLLLDEISDHNVREQVLNHIISAAYSLPGENREASDRVVLDQILQLQNQNIMDELLAHFIMRNIAAVAGGDSSEIFREAASQIEHLEMRSNMLALLDDAVSQQRRLDAEDERKEGRE